MLELFTSCLRRKRFPPSWKRARLALIPKGKGKPADDPSVYRPVCLLDEAGKSLRNCGTYVMYYLDCIIHNKTIDTMFNSAEYRLTVATTLLRSSRSMKDICQYCFSDRDISLVMCNTCRRWVHQLCLKRKFNDSTNWEHPDAKYRCLLCSKGFRPWMKYTK
ncbi:hypothetical protein X777_02176 [Ooceraea biroi]|uniref:PHD-type domain-containing protein n=1 Tax=Ooceraea biroi TaxID=2015173 RepID=A0A026WRC2_OOCBI|nr:hypothetical protein X777_02176 [Ooceraea biroi]